MQTRDLFTLVKDALCMIVALGGAIYEAHRDGPERWGLLAFYALLPAFGTAVPAAQSLFGSTNQAATVPPEPPVTPGPVSLQHPARVAPQDGDAATTR